MKPQDLQKVLDRLDVLEDECIRKRARQEIAHERDEWGRHLHTISQMDVADVQYEKAENAFNSVRYAALLQLEHMGLCADPEDGLTSEESQHDFFQGLGFNLYQIGNGWCG